MSFLELDDETEMGYTPSMGSNSRSAGMKKLTRKADPKPAPIVTKKQDDFDLLDELLASPVANNKKSVIGGIKEATSKVFHDNNDIDSFFDEPSPGMPSRNTGKTGAASNGRPFTAAPANTISITVEDNIIEEPSGARSNFKFKRPETANPNSKPPAEDPPEISFSTSTRMMKPPLRRRESQERTNNDDGPKPRVELSLTLPDTTTKPGLNLAEPVSAASRGGFGASRNRSNDLESQATNQLVLPEVAPSESRNPSRLVASSNADSRNFSVSFGKEEGRTKKLEIPVEPSKQPAAVPKQIFSTFSAPMAPVESPPAPWPVPTHNPGQAVSTRPSSEQLEKEVQFIKQNYQKHIDSLQKNLEQQIRQNKASRDRLMNETTSMIDNERNRMTRIHEEELERVKHMADWEKRKLEDNYKAEVALLRSQLEKHTQAAAEHRRDYSGYGERQEIEYLEEKLKGERKLIEEKAILLDKREQQLEEKERAMGKRRRAEEERLREEQKRIFQLQMDSKKQVLHEKRALEEEKQAIAAELAGLELGNFKKIESVEMLKSEMEMRRRELEKERVEMRNINNQIMLDYQTKCDELWAEKEKVVRMEAELLSKIKMVEANATRQRFSTTKPVGHDNTWSNPGTANNFRPSSAPKKGMSIEKSSQQAKLQQTQNRFMEMASSVRENVRMQRKGQDFDINNYLMGMAHYTRSREPLH